MSGDNDTTVTTSEAYLAKLCRRAFLYLWSYPNLYRDQGRSGLAGHGKELCDLLVVFGDDVLIFSDKHCTLQTDKDVTVVWRRWYRDAVLKSAAQIMGAERWLQQQPDRVFLDRVCTKPLPIRLPTTPRFHRIITCRGAADASRNAWGGSGSLFVTNRRLEDCSNTPFHLGSMAPDGRIFHVLDEVSLDAVLQTLDTVSDFVEYLTKKEKFFLRFPSVIAAGEEDLLGFYLWSLRKDGGGHDFIVEKDVTYVAIDEDFWASWRQSVQCKAKIAADQVSYSWDRLIEKFSLHMLNGTQYFPTEGGVKEGEIIVRWMAREPRVRRRMLAESVIGMMRSTGQGQLRRRIVLPQSDGDPYWVFLVLPRPVWLTYDDYHDFRNQFLVNHCLVAKYLHPAATDVIGIAVEPQQEELSEDAVYIDVREWNEDLAQHAKTLHEEAGIFRNPVRLESTYWEFPLPD